MTQNQLNQRLPIPDALRQVPKLLPAMLPSAIEGIVFDGAGRIGCQPDYLYAAIVCHVTSLLSPLVSVMPKQFDDSWIVSVNMAGVAVGDPSSKKSAAINYIKGIIKSHCKENGLEYVHFLDSTTAQAVLKHAARMEDGIVVISSDEISGFLDSIDTKSQEEAQSIYLTAIDGNSSYTTGRSTVDEFSIDRLQVGMLGGIQPEKLLKIIDKLHSKNGNTGFVSRILFIVYPDSLDIGLGADRAEDKEAVALFKKFLAYASRIQKGTKLHYSLEAQQVFNEWSKSRTDLVNYEHELLRSSYAKAAPFVCSLALLFEVAICSEVDRPLQNISLDALEYAIANYDYIWEHTRRVFESGDSYVSNGAKLLLKRLEEGKVPMKPRSYIIDTRALYQRQWSHLNSAEKAKAALELLERYGHVSCVRDGKSPNYLIHEAYREYYSNS